jgi:hypothetical protein
MAVKSAADALKRWQAAMSSGTARQNYIDGINGTTVNPMAEAASPGKRCRSTATTCWKASRRPARAQADAGFSAAVWKTNAVNFGASASWPTPAKKGAAKYQRGRQTAQGTWQQMQDAAKGATGTLEKIRAALNVQLQAAGKPTI